MQRPTVRLSTIWELVPQPLFAEVEALTARFYQSSKENLQMNKDPLSDALAKSLQDESTVVDKRFETSGQRSRRAGRPRPGPPRQAKPPKKIPVIRDTFSFPEFDYVLLSELQAALLKNGHNVSKSELVRAGLKALAQMRPAQLIKTAKAVEKLKPGRSRGSS